MSVPMDILVIEDRLLVLSCLSKVRQVLAAVSVLVRAAAHLLRRLTAIPRLVLVSCPAVVTVLLSALLVMNWLIAWCMGLSPMVMLCVVEPRDRVTSSPSMAFFGERYVGYFVRRRTQFWMLLCVC